MSIVILHPHGGMGDLILSFPVVQAFRDAFPAKEIFYITPPRMEDIARAHPAVSEAFSFDSGNAAAVRLLKVLKSKHVSIGCALWSTARVAWLLRLSGARIRIGQKGRILSSFLFTHQVEVRSTKKDTESHWVECLLDYPRAIGLNPQNKKISIAPSADGVEKVVRLFHEMRVDAGEAIAVVHAGKGENVLQRGWPVDLFAHVGDKLSQQGFRVLFTGGKSEVELVEVILGKMQKEGLSLAGKTDFQTLASTLKQASVIICPDSGPMHLAAAVGTPVVALFAMEKDFPKRWAPWDVEHLIIRPDAFPCRPWCAKETCLDFRCYRQLSADQIVEGASLLAKKKADRIKHG